MRQIYFEDANWCQCTMSVSDSNADALRRITAHELFEHVRQCIGKVTPEGLERFIPEYVPEGSDLKISIQVHYYLWKKRIEGKRKLEDNSPITAKELESIIGGEDQGESLPVDVRVILGSTHILPATQMCIDELVHYLRSMEQGPNCGPSIEDEQPTLYAILTDSSLTKLEMVDGAIRVIDLNTFERETLIQLVEMARDAKGNCPYTDVQYYVERYASRTLDRLCDLIALRLACE